jgi:hypothetical protein
MKHGMKPTRAEKKIIASWGLNAENWLVVKHTPALLLIEHRLSGQTREIKLKEEDEEE